MNTVKSTQLLRSSLRLPDLQNGPVLMGIVNVTPDSFSDGGHLCSSSAAIAYALRLAEDGADIIDVGGESTRPGAADISVDEELQRVLPVIEGIRSVSKVPVSIDTRKARVAEAALAAGAGIVNDISALRHDPDMTGIVAAAGVPVILMHMAGTPAIMQKNPEYGDVVREVVSFLFARMQYCALHGIYDTIIDPGFGFGKNLEHNLRLLAALPELVKLGAPVLVGVSRKSMIGELTGRAVDQRLSGSIAAAVLALQKGATMFRVHDVRESREALNVANAILREEKHYAV